MSDKTELAYFGGAPIINGDFVSPTWPVITQDYEVAVQKQLHESVSIYNRSGIIEEFEDRFAALHDRKYALLNNSGTNSIWAMFVAAGLLPGDEVLCPTYTFFATNTPLLSSGLVPVFCDADENGCIDPADIERRITDRTKAIIVTHMWGYPCDMDRIVAIAKQHNLYLFEDCSHAHLAAYKNRRVGTFGDAAAWSLQGQKNITGGEGGILLTDNQDMYIRANLLGHYNKRCKDEIPKDHPLYEFAVTGMGLKMRSHPLAVSFANEMLNHHDAYQNMRAECARAYEDLLATYDFIDVLPHNDTEPSWYAFIFKYKQKGSITREQLAEMLQAEGLSEVDIPGSTAPNHSMPLFDKPSVLFPQFYHEGQSFNVGEFPGAQAFYDSIIKLPTWTQPAHREVLDSYIAGLRKVLDYVNREA